MTHLKNNGIALGVHALLAGIYFAIASAIRPMESSILYLIAFIVCFLGYVACGLFLLRPVKKARSCPCCLFWARRLQQFFVSCSWKGQILKHFFTMSIQTQSHLSIIIAFPSLFLRHLN